MSQWDSTRLKITYPGTLTRASLVNDWIHFWNPELIIDPTEANTRVSSYPATLTLASQFPHSRTRTLTLPKRFHFIHSLWSWDLVHSSIESWRLLWLLLSLRRKPWDPGCADGFSLNSYQPESYYLTDPGQTSGTSRTWWACSTRRPGSWPRLLEPKLLHRPVLTVLCYVSAPSARMPIRPSWSGPTQVDAQVSRPALQVNFHVPMLCQTKVTLPKSEHQEQESGAEAAGRMAVAGRRRSTVRIPRRRLQPLKRMPRQAARGGTPTWMTEQFSGLQKRGRQSCGFTAVVPPVPLV